MFATVKRLAYWKSEHDDKTCEDASLFDAAAGLFAVADGAGTAAFSNIWARIIVEHFLAVPLMSDDRFEVEWWLRIAQEEYSKKAPPLAAMQGAARKKAQEGSYTTLVTLRICAVERERVQVDLCAFGDSCVLVCRAGSGEDNLRFPLEKAADFARGPICLPSYLKRFDRNFTRCLVRSTSFAPGDRVMLATDAVAKWVIGGGGQGEACYQEAFEHVAGQTIEGWPDFIQQCRESEQMVDDDVTALVLTFERDGARAPDSQELGAAIEHLREVQEARRRAFEEAKQRQDKEAMAIAYGDGRVFGNSVGQFSPEIAEARAVADALHEVRQALRGAINTPDPQSIVGPIWRKHQAMLEREVCAQEIVESLRQNGLLTPPPAAQTPLPPFQPRAHVPAPVPGPAMLERSRPAVALTPSSEHSGVANRLTTPQQESQLLAGLQKALEVNDEEQMVAVYEAILRSPVRANLLLTTEQEARVQQARQRAKALVHLLPLLRNGTPEEKVTAFDYESEENQQWLKPEELEQVSLARNFTEALKANDDQELWRAYQMILHSPTRPTFLLTGYESRLRQVQASPELASLPVNAHLRDLEQAVGEGNLEQIRAAFEVLRLNFADLPGQLRQRVEPAVKLVRAMEEDSRQADETVIQAYNALFHVPGNRSRFVPEVQYQQRVQQAQRRLQAPEQSWRVYCTVNNRPVMMKRIGDLEALRSWYVTLRYQELGKRLGAGEDRATRLEWEELGEMKQDKPEKILTEDCLIQEALEGENAQGKLNRPEFEGYLQDRVRGLLPRLRKEAANAPAVQGLEDVEIRAVLEVFVRRRWFAGYLAQQGNHLRDWLKKQKKKADIREMY